MTSTSLIGIGTDIVECQRIADMIAKHDELFIQRVYTAAEIDYCSARKASAQHFAGRWAAKEAVLKAIGTGWAKGIQWTDIEIVNDGGGKPSVQLHRSGLVVAQSCGISDILISISHCQTFAVAFATAIG